MLIIAGCIVLTLQLPVRNQMQRRRLGGSGLVVSDICLGTMTFGAQAEESEAFRIMDHAYENGINFLDAAELYPVATRDEDTFHDFSCWARLLESISPS